jgi:hypothetical protein
MSRRTRRILLFAVLALGCAPPEPSTALYAHPWPDERLRRADGTLDVSSFPYGTGAPLRAEVIDALGSADGFGVSSAIVFPMDEVLDPESLPSVEASTRPGASVVLVNVDRSSPELGRLMPLDVRQLANGGPFGGANLLVALPFPGVPLAARTLYAAVVTTDARTVETQASEEAPISQGRSLPAAPEDAPTDAHREARAQLAELGMGPDRIAALAVLRTGDPTRELFDAFAQAQTDAARFDAAPELVEEYNDYCVYRTTLAMPVFRIGDRELLLRESLDTLEARLPPFGFLRANRGALVRRDAIEAWDAAEGGSVVLHDGSRVPVSRRAASALRAALGLGER